MRATATLRRGAGGFGAVVRGALFAHRAAADPAGKVFAGDAVAGPLLDLLGAAADGVLANRPDRADRDGGTNRHKRREMNRHGLIHNRNDSHLTPKAPRVRRLFAMVEKPRWQASRSFQRPAPYLCPFKGRKRTPEGRIGHRGLRSRLSVADRLRKRSRSGVMIAQLGKPSTRAGQVQENTFSPVLPTEVAAVEAAKIAAMRMHESGDDTQVRVFGDDLQWRTEWVHGLD